MKGSVLTGIALGLSFGILSQVTDIEGGVYQTVKIGSQVWTAENLNVSRFRNGDTIFQALTDEQWMKATENEQPAWCYFDNDAKNGEEFGKLYNWFAVNDPRGLAPEGWKIPSYDDWIVLSDHFGGDELAGSKLKHKEAWSSSPYGINGTNEGGFSVIPAGGRTGNGFDYFGNKSIAIFWSNTSKNEYWIHTRCIYPHNDNFQRNNFDTTCGFSVRCLKE